MYFPDELSFVGEDVTEAYNGWRMFFDGTTNFKGVGIGAVLVSEMGQHYPVSNKLKFPCTNNMAEYEAYILGLNMAIDMNIPELLVIGIEKEVHKDRIQHMPKIQNEFVDALATLSSMMQHPDKNYIDPIPVRVHNQPAYCAHVEEEADGKPWFHDIKEYLSKGEYPEHVNHIQKCTLRRLSNHFFHSGENLYGRTPDLGLLRCVDTREASKILEDVFILVAIDYFTKWVEAASYKAVTKKFDANFVKDHIVCPFGVPKSIITDNTANLNSDLMKAICETFNIKHKNSTTYRPHMNGAVKAANKNIKKILMNMAVIPAEVKIPSLRDIQEAELSDAEWIKSCYEQLSLINGKRMNEVCHGQLYQNKMSRAFNRRVKPRLFAPGQLALKKSSRIKMKPKGNSFPTGKMVTTRAIVTDDVAPRAGVARGKGRG
ncbi:uncharacterized protein [Nicotiana sylvestris]|uniref:uncharacterized protein n=1 Tax=Nicotiana sylvestris TaxID=4096 RepID=UPI00388C960B